MKYYIIAFLTVFTLKSFAQKQYLIKGATQGIINNEKIFLLIQDTYSLHRFFLKDSTVIKNNSFQFSGHIKRPSETARIYTLDKKRVLKDNYNFYLDSGTNELTFDNNFVCIGSNKSPATLHYETIEAVYKSYYYKYAAPDKLSPQIKTITLDQQKSANLTVLPILLNYPDDYHSLIELSKMASNFSMNSNLNDLLDCFKKLSPTIRGTPLGQEFVERVTSQINAKNASRVGMPVPVFSIKDDKGNIFINSKLSGKPYILAFSATWCIPCQAFQKTLLELYHKYQSQGLQIVYFNLDDNVSKWKKHIAEKKLDWINVSERTKFRDSNIARQFNAKSIPLYLIVNKQGNITYNADEMKDDDYTQLEDYIKSAIKN